MPQCIEERPVELFDIMVRLPGIIKLVSGNLEVYRLISSANDETIIRTFKDCGKVLEISKEQFFYGSNHFPAIGFVRLDGNEVRICKHIGDLWTCPPRRKVYRTKGTTIFAQASQASEPRWAKTTIIRF